MTVRGLTLIELLVTLVVLTVGLSMLVSVLARGVRDSDRVQEVIQRRYRTDAAHLVHQVVPGNPS